MTKGIANYLLDVAAEAGNDMTDEEWDDLIKVTFHEAPGDLGETLWVVAGELATRRQTIQRLEAAVKRARARDVEENGPVRYKDTFVTVTPKTTKEVTDPEEMVAYFEGTDPRAVFVLFRLNADNLRITALRQLAERQYRERLGDEEAPTKEEIKQHQRTVEDTFLIRTKEPAELKEMPIDKAPKWTQTLGHGMRAGSFKNKEN